MPVERLVGKIENKEGRVEHYHRDQIAERLRFTDIREGSKLSEVLDHLLRENINPYRVLMDLLPFLNSRTDYGCFVSSMCKHEKDPIMEVDEPVLVTISWLELGYLQMKSNSKKDEVVLYHTTHMSLV